MTGGAGSVALLIALLAARSAAAQPRPTVSGTLERIHGARGDSAIDVRVALTMSDGWHIGARTPGVVGVPTKLEWHLPKGWSVANEVWPRPEGALIGRDSAFTYAGSLTIHASLIGPKAGAREQVEAVLSYAICRDMCIPGQITLRLAR